MCVSCPGVSAMNKGPNNIRQVSTNRLSFGLIIVMKRSSTNRKRVQGSGSVWSGYDTINRASGGGSGHKEGGPGRFTSVNFNYVFQFPKFHVNFRDFL
jgi:hypothetical protein